MIDKQTLARKLGVDDLETLPRDVSPRHYFRGNKDGKAFIVMLYPDASAENLNELKGFIDIGRWLDEQGVKTPSLYEISEQDCYGVFEDLGTTSFGKCYHQGVLDKPNLYAFGTDVLVRIKDAEHVIDGLPHYSQSRINQNRRQLLDYYHAYRTGVKTAEGKVDEFFNVWDEIEAGLPPCPQGFVHGDFHLENLMYCEAEKGIKQCALIDYQDALFGPLPYDLVNLLEDARIDVPDDIRQKMIKRYCAGMSEQEEQAFLCWYRVLCAQFHGRVLGLFIKLAAEQERDSYLIHIARLQDYMRKSLQDPVLAPLKAWFDKEGVDFTPLNELDGNHIRKVFRNISFP